MSLLELNLNAIADDLFTEEGRQASEVAPYVRNE